MARPKVDTQAQLASAFGELVKRGDVVTVRSLRTEAGVSTNDAAAWLRANRAAEATPDVPADELAGTVAALWAVAVSTARDELRTQSGNREAELVDAEARALADVDAERATNTELSAQLTQLRIDTARELERLTQELATQTAQLAEAVRTAEAERATAREAEQRAARAEATAATLQRVVDQNFPPAKK